MSHVRYNWEEMHRDQFTVVALAHFQLLVAALFDFLRRSSLHPSHLCTSQINGNRDGRWGSACIQHSIESGLDQDLDQDSNHCFSTDLPLHSSSFSNMIWQKEHKYIIV